MKNRALMLIGGTIVAVCVIVLLVAHTRHGNPSLVWPSGQNDQPSVTQAPATAALK